MTSRGLCVPLVLAILAWGYNFVALKIVYAEVSPAAAALMRHVIMFFVLVAVCRVWFKSTSEALGGMGTWFWGGWRVALFGALSMGLYMILFMEALARTSAPEGAIVIATAPLFTTLFAVAAKQETFSSRVVLGALVAFSGVVMVVFGGSEVRMDHLLGNGLMLVSAIAWALSAVVSRPLVQQRQSIAVLTQSMPAALIVLVPYAAKDFVATPWLDLTWQSYLGMAHFTLMAGALGFAGFFYGVQQVGASGAMYYQFCVAPLATLFAWIFLGDALHPVQIVGMGVVLAGVVLATVARGKSAEKEIMPFECPAEA
jgi:drug/metabolite transporter (DMT)-like permease